MADNFKKLYQGQLGTSAATLITAAVGASVIIKHMSVVNADVSGSHSFTLWHDGTADTNLIVPAATVVSGGWANFDGTLLMEASDTLSGKASSASKLTITIYGDEVTA